MYVCYSFALCSSCKFVTSPWAVVAKYCYERVCLYVSVCVCLSVAEDISRTTRAMFSNFCVAVGYGRGSVLVRQGGKIPRERGGDRFTTNFGTTSSLSIPRPFKQVSALYCEASILLNWQKCQACIVINDGWQGSVATCSTCGGLFINDFTTGLLLTLLVTEFVKFC